MWPSQSWAVRSIAASTGGVRVQKRRVFLRGMPDLGSAVSEQARRLPKWVMQAAVGAVVGLAMGFAIGWWLWPVQYTNTAPNVLRQDYHDDYILMVATAYAVEGNLGQARERLELCDPEEPAAPVVELAERLVKVGGSAEDITHLARLGWALGTLTPTLTPYLEGQP